MWNNVKEHKSHNDVIKKNFWFVFLIFLLSPTMRYKHCFKSDADLECLESSKLVVFAAAAT